MNHCHSTFLRSFPILYLPPFGCHLCCLRIEYNLYLFVFGFYSNMTSMFKWKFCNKNIPLSLPPPPKKKLSPNSSHLNSGETEVAAQWNGNIRWERPLSHHFYSLMFPHCLNASNKLQLRHPVIIQTPAANEWTSVLHYYLKGDTINANNAGVIRDKSKTHHFISYIASHYYRESFV